MEGLVALTATTDRLKHSGVRSPNWVEKLHRSQEAPHQARRCDLEECLARLHFALVVLRPRGGSETTNEMDGENEETGQDNQSAWTVLEHESENKS